MDKLKLLVAEDDETTLSVYKKKALDDTVFETRFAENGREVINEYNSWKPDIILLDIYMPIMTGFSVLKEIRENNCDTSTAIIMVTSAAGKEDIMQCMHLGIQGYVVKPFAVRGLTDKILEYYEKLDPEKARAAMAELKK